MAVSKMSEPMVKQSLFDEAVRASEKCVTQANRQLTISRLAVDSIVDALELMKSGRIIHARERLDKTLVIITRMGRP